MAWEPDLGMRAEMLLKLLGQQLPAAAAVTRHRQL